MNSHESAITLSPSDIHNSVQVSPSNTMFHEIDGELCLTIDTRETVTITTTTAISTQRFVTIRIGKTLDQIRNELIAANIDSIIEQSQHLIAPDLAREILEQNLKFFPTLRDVGTVERVYNQLPVDEPFISWALDCLGRAYWIHKFFEHYCDDLTSALHSEDRAVEFLGDLDKGHRLGLILKAFTEFEPNDQTLEALKSILLTEAEKWLKDQRRASKEHNAAHVSLSDLENSKGDPVPMEETLGLSCDIEGNRNVPAPVLRPGRKWNGFTPKVERYESGKPYAEGKVIEYNGQLYLSLTDFNTRHQPGISPDFWELQVEDLRPKRKAPAFQKTRRKGRLKRTPRKSACDDYLRLLLSEGPSWGPVRGPQTLPEILRGCADPFGQKPFGRKMILSALGRIASLDYGIYTLHLGEIHRAQELWTMLDPDLQARERAARIESWDHSVDDRIRAENIGQGFDLGEELEDEEASQEVLSLKELYRRCCFKVHPDLGDQSDVEDQQLRVFMMMSVNSAYDRKDAKELRRILALYDDKEDMPAAS